MPSLASFGDFVKSTGAKIVYSPDRIINDATKHTYFISEMLKGRDVAQTVQGGSTIKENVQLTDAGTAVFYDPNEDLDIQNVDVQQQLEIRWRFMADHFTYTEQEVTLNSGDSQTYLKNLLKGKRQARVTSTFNKMETQLWAPASNAQMEAATGKQPYSIPALVTADGLAPSGFTTIHGLNPSTIPGWRNQVRNYDPDNVIDMWDGLLAAFDLMFLDVQFESPMGGPAEYFENDRLKKMKICTNTDGRALLSALTRDANDRLIPADNLGWMANNVTYAGIPVRRVKELDTSLINGGAVITAGEPWFFFLNLAYLFPVFHSARYMKELPPKDHPRQPFSKVVWSDTYWNNFCVSRRRQGLITPS